MSLKHLGRLALAALVCAVGVGLTATAFGQAGKRYKEQIQQYAKQLDQLKKQDKWDVSQKDRQRARQWLADAKELIAQGDTDTASWLVKQVGESLDLIEAMVTAKKIEAMADEQQETYHKAKESRIPELEGEVEELRNQKAELEEKLRQLQ